MRRTILPVVALSLVLGACGPRSTPVADADGAVTMAHNLFSVETREISVGDRVTFSNSGSRIVHVLAVGRDGQPRSAPDAPTFGPGSRHKTDIGDRWTTPPWTTPGTFHVTCTLHPSMNLTVVVGSA